MSHRTSIIALAVLGGVSVASTAQADITSIDEFQGDVFDGFEDLGPPGSIPGPVDILDGNATLNDQLANIVISATSLHSFDTGETIFPHTGDFMAGLPTGFAEIVFDEPVRRFGGFIGTVDILSGGSVVFFDEQDNVIDEVPFEIPLNEWTWYGWESTTGIKRIELFANTNPSRPIVLDDVRMSFVPAPGAAALLIGGGLLTSRRRRR